MRLNPKINRIPDFEAQITMFSNMKTRKGAVYFETNTVHLPKKIKLSIKLLTFLNSFM